MINTLFLTSILQTLINLDNTILLFVNGFHNSFGDIFMYTFSNKWVWVPFYASILFVLYKNMNLKNLIFCLITITILITISDQVASSLIRPYVMRLRPANLDNIISNSVHIVNNYRGGKYGFPSSHSTNTWAFTFFLYFYLRYKPLFITMIFWSIITCWSRMYLGVHYFGDLFVGFIIGFLASILIYFILKKLTNYKHTENVTHGYIPIITFNTTVFIIIIIALFGIKT